MANTRDGADVSSPLRLAAAAFALLPSRMDLFLELKLSNTCLVLRVLETTLLRLGLPIPLLP
jgi:hypothetical protein